MNCLPGVGRYGWDVSACVDKGKWGLKEERERKNMECGNFFSKCSVHIFIFLFFFINKEMCHTCAHGNSS